VQGPQRGLKTCHGNAETIAMDAFWRSSALWRAWPFRYTSLSAPGRGLCAIHHLNICGEPDG